MPILAPETSMFPDNLLDGFSQSTEGNWWAVYTKARQEKAVARQLVGRDVPFYLPLVAKDNLLRGRRVSSHVPLFGGYLFLFGTGDDKLKCQMTNRISMMLPVEDDQALIEDLQAVRQLIASDAPLTVERRLLPGDRIRVKAGSMAGTEGTVIRRHGKSRLVVAVRLLQQGVSVEIDDFLLEPIG